MNINTILSACMHAERLLRKHHGKIAVTDDSYGMVLIELSRSIRLLEEMQTALNLLKELMEDAN